MKRKVVILGAGFAGLTVAKGLGHSDCEVVVLDRNNHHLFQPLLYQVATAMLSPADIAVPIRHLLAGFSNISVKMVEVTGVDLAARAVLGKDFRESYDRLVIATGARSHYFGNLWEGVAPGLKDLEDARHIRKQILSAFERAEVRPETAEEELTFVIIGGGPTGVELAGAIAELTHQTIIQDFRKAHVEDSRILLVEAGPRILGTFSEESSCEAVRVLTEMGVEIRTQTRVTGIDESGIQIGAQKIESKTVIWAAGVAATPIAQWLGVESDRQGRVKVTPYLELPNHSEVFVIGDVALVDDDRHQPLPGVAPVAMQEGRYVARRLLGNESRPFLYRNKGSLTTIGRRHAVAEFGKWHIKGHLAWWVWTFVHIYYLIGFRNRLFVLLEWGWAYMTRARGARLVSSNGHAKSNAPATFWAQK